MTVKLSRMLSRHVRDYIASNILKNPSLTSARLTFRQFKSTTSRSVRSGLPPVESYRQRPTKTPRTEAWLEENIPTARRIRSAVVYILPWIPIYLVVEYHVATIMSVNGLSMWPLFNGEHKSDEPNQNDKVFVNLLYPHQGLKRGMVVVFCSPRNPERYTIKRIVALAGDAITPSSDRYPGGKREIIVPYNHMWVEGDTKERENNLDSNTYGPITQSLVVGKVMGVVWPFRRISRISWKDWKGCDRLREDAVMLKHPDDDMVEKTQERIKIHQAKLAEVQEVPEPSK